MAVGRVAVLCLVALALAAEAHAAGRGLLGEAAPDAAKGAASGDAAGAGDQGIPGAWGGSNGFMMPGMGPSPPAGRGGSPFGGGGGGGGGGGNPFGSGFGGGAPTRGGGLFGGNGGGGGGNPFGSGLSGSAPSRGGSLFGGNGGGGGGAPAAGSLGGSPLWGQGAPDLSSRPGGSGMAPPREGWGGGGGNMVGGFGSGYDRPSGVTTRPGGIPNMWGGFGSGYDRPSLGQGTLPGAGRPSGFGDGASVVPGARPATPPAAGGLFGGAPTTSPWGSGGAGTPATGAPLGARPGVLQGVGGNGNGGGALGTQFNPAWGNSGGGGGGNPWAGRQYDRSVLSGLVPASPPRVSGAAPGPVSTDARRFSDSIASGDAISAARNMIAAGRTDVAADGLVDAASRGRRARIGDALAAGAALDRGAMSRVMARSANLALLRGQTDAFGASVADGFVASRRRGSIRDYGLAMADAISTGGDYGRYTYGQAMAKAVAQGGDGQAAVAEATAQVFCAGGSAANAWSSAFAVALSEDSNGCLVLSQARAMASASCGGGAFNSHAESDATSRVLGFCGILPPGLVPGFSFSSNDSGSNTWGGRK